MNKITNMKDQLRIAYVGNRKNLASDGKSFNTDEKN